MSFGASNQEKQFSNNLGGTSNLALGQMFPTAMRGGSQFMQEGMGNTQQAANFFRNLLSGNQNQTTQMLMPDINRIRGMQQGSLQAASTLMPRGGGRSSTLFGLPFQSNAAIQNLFSGARTNAGNILGQMGLTQSGQGINLFGVGNQALGTANQANTAGLDWAQKKAAADAAKLGGIGSSLFGLATMPLTGPMGLGNTAIGKLGGLFH